MGKHVLFLIWNSSKHKILRLISKGVLRNIFKTEKINCSFAHAMNWYLNLIVECIFHIPLQGKGIMKTYWLNGKDGYDKPLPGRDLAVSLSQHEFK